MASVLRSGSGNGVTGAYSKSETASDDYEMQQIGPSFTLDAAGTNSYTDVETGNTVTGLYTRTKTGTDVYSMSENGINLGGQFDQTVTGTDSYVLVDDGNLGTGHYTRTITGSGTYDRTTTGPGARMRTGSGTIDYVWTQTGDPQSGTFDLTQNGTDRYDLLEHFFDISNTSNGQTPGHMNIYPFGQTFVDPGPGDGGFWDSFGNSLLSIPQRWWGIAQMAASPLTGDSQGWRDTMGAAYDRGPLGQSAEGPGWSYYGTRGALAVATLATGAIVAIEAAPVGAAAYSALRGAAHYGINLSRLQPTATVAAHAATRPYINSPLTVRLIIESARPVANPGGVPGALRWVVPGSFNGSRGMYELVIDPATNRILHFLFRSTR